MWQEYKNAIPKNINIFADIKGVTLVFQFVFFKTKIALKQNIKVHCRFWVPARKTNEAKHLLPFMSSSFINFVHHGLTITCLPLGVFFFKLNFDTFLSLHLATQFSVFIVLYFVFVQTKSLCNQNVDSFIICKQCYRWNCEATTNKSNNLM